MNKKYDIGVMRHSLAHVMAAAVKNLYPEAKFGMDRRLKTVFIMILIWAAKLWRRTI